MTKAMTVQKVDDGSCGLEISKPVQNQYSPLEEANKGDGEFDCDFSYKSLFDECKEPKIKNVSVDCQASGSPQKDNGIQVECAKPMGAESMTIKSTSFRKDVVTKTLIRSIKKYYTDLFKSETSFFDISDMKERRQTAINHIQTFVENEFYGKDINNVFEGVTRDDIVY